MVEKRLKKKGASVCTLKERIEAMDDLTTVKDRGVLKLCEEAETLFKEKIIKDGRNDWLACQEEDG
jgi:hypothetical protein